MAVKNGDFIKIDYTQSVDGQIIATTDKELATSKGIFDEETQYGPHLIVVGSGQLVAGMEEDLLDKEIGYSGRIEIPPEKAFRTHDPKKVEIIPINKFKDEKPAPGMRVGVDNKVGVVTRIIGRKVSVDFNHPLADKTVSYEYKILENVEDQVEKLKSLIKTFARLDLESKIDNHVATIIVPWELGYYKEWLMIRRGLADMIIQHLGLKEVDFIEKHTGEKIKAELVSPPGDASLQEASQPEALSSEGNQSEDSSPSA